MDYILQSWWGAYVLWVAATVSGYLSYRALDSRSMLYWQFLVSTIFLYGATFLTPEGSRPVKVIVSGILLVLLIFAVRYIDKRDDRKHIQN